jgi:hypothetical protein
MSQTAMAPMAPTAVSGSVLNYYVDRAGYVTGAAIQGPNGPQWVSFPASMAQQLTTTYPVGSSAALFVNSANQVVGTGTTAPTVLPPTLPVDTSGNHAGVATLMAIPYTTVGAQRTTVHGKLTGWVANKFGDVLALILDHNTLVRVPPQNRVGGNLDNTPEGVRPLFKGEDIVATGLPEAPVFGAISRFQTRLIAHAIVVNGESLGSRGFGTVVTSGWEHKKNPNNPYHDLGYTVYSANGDMDEMAPATTAASDSTGTPDASMHHHHHHHHHGDAAASGSDSSSGSSTDSGTTGTTNGGTSTGTTGTDNAGAAGTSSSSTTDSTSSNTTAPSPGS